MATRAEPIGLYGWIQSNDGRSTGLFLAFLLAIQLIAPLTLVGPLLLVDIDHAPFFGWSGYLVRYAPVVLACSILWFVAQLWWHLETVKRAVGFAFVDDADEPRLCRVIEPLIIVAGLPVPFVGVIESDARNAFACGIGRSKAVVVVTRGLIDALDDAELGSVLAHELSHIRNGDIRLMAAVTIFMTALTKLHTRNALRFTWVHALLVIAVPAVLPLALIGGLLGRWAMKMGQVSRLLIASSREFIADAESAQWTRNPAALASALLKIDGHHRLEHARAEDDAMMIAGETLGPEATHPTVAQRVAALARVTGSMVYNAPSAPRADSWTRETTPEAVAKISFGRRAETAYAIGRVRQGDGEDVLGLDLYGRCALIAAVLALAGLHLADLDDPHALAATFDPRPIALMAATPVACELGTFLPSYKRTCVRNTDGHAFRDFEGQHNTLAGYLADLNRQRREPDGSTRDESLIDLAFGRSTAKTFGAARTNGAKQSPGCFPWKRLPFAHHQPLPLEAEAPGGHTVGSIVDEAGQLRQDITVASSSPDVFLDYLHRRETLLGLAFDAFGHPGLVIVQNAFERPEHERVIAALRARMDQVLQSPGIAPDDQAALRALASRPSTFLPCRSVGQSTHNPGN